VANVLLATDGPCPCGSGRLLGDCCWSRYAAEVDVWRRAQAAERRLAKSVITYATARWGQPLFRMALRLFFSSAVEASEFRLCLLPVFDRWLAFTWVPRLDDDPFFLVTGTTPGWSLALKNLLTGEPLVVVDPEIAARARPDDVLFSAVQSVGGVRLLLGPAPYSVPLEVLHEVGEVRRFHTSAGEWMTPPDIAEFDMAFELSDICGRAWSRSATAIFEAGAEPREPLHLAWWLSGGFGDAVECLRPLTICYDDDYVEMAIGPDGAPLALLMWFERGPSDDPDDWRCIGYLYLSDGRLSADVPSRAHADRLLNEVARRLGAAAIVQEIRSAVPVRVHDRGCWLPVFTA
jgi:hypothetical protein